MAKKTVIVLIICFICICIFASSVGSWGAGTVYVVVVDWKYRNPVSWAYVSVDSNTCWNLGWGFYTCTTSIGWHCIYVWGRPQWVNVGWGTTVVNVYL